MVKLLRKREPNGRYQRPSKQEQEFAPAAIVRLRNAAINAVLPAEWGSVAGQMFLTGRISATEYSCTKRWHALATKYHHALGCHGMKSAQMERSHSHPPDPDSDEGRLQARREARDRSRYEAACRVLEAIGCRSAVDRCVLEDQAPAGIEELERLKKGLAALAAHWKYR